MNPAVPPEPPAHTTTADAAMGRYADGDDAAFAIVYDEVSPRLRAFLNRRCPERSEDLLQQTFLAMHRSRASFCPGAAVMPWAFAIARRLLIDEYRGSRRNDRRQELPPSEPHDASMALQAQQLYSKLLTELEELPERQREAFQLIRLDGFTLEEAAIATGTTISSMKSLSHRAQETLRTRLWRLFDR